MKPAFVQTAGAFDAEKARGERTVWNWFTLIFGLPQHVEEDPGAIRQSEKNELIKIEWEQTGKCL